MGLIGARRMNFQRYSLFEKKTLAWRLFKRHHTHFNDTYWSHVAASKYTFSSTSSHQREDPASNLFSFALGDRRIPATLGQWADSYSDFNKWIHISAIVALCGYLETYIAQASTAALESNPAIVLGGGPRIDGAIYLKNNPSYTMFPHVTDLVRGDWQARAACFLKLFGSCPHSPYIGDLERL